MGTKNNPGNFDCYANAEPDEPMFVLLARDRDAPAVIEEWVRRRKERYPYSDAFKIEEALRCANEMRAWFAGKVKLLVGPPDPNVNQK